MKEKERQLRAEVRRLLAQAEAADAAEDASTGQLSAATNYPPSFSGARRD
jgi:hypothetical protein